MFLCGRLLERQILASFVSVWFISLSIMPSRATQAVASGRVCFYFEAAGWCAVCVCHALLFAAARHCMVCVPPLLCAFICRRHLGCCHILAVANSAAVTCGADNSVWYSDFDLLGPYPDRPAGSCGPCTVRVSQTPPMVPMITRV